MRHPRPGLKGRPGFWPSTSVKTLIFEIFWNFLKFQTTHLPNPTLRTKNGTTPPKGGGVDTRKGVDVTVVDSSSITGKYF